MKANQAWKPVKGKKYEVETVGNAVVKLYRRKRETTDGETRFVFEVADYTAGRRRLCGFGDLGKARREAKRIAGQLATGDATAATMRNSQAASFGRSMELIRPTGASLELVCAVYAKCYEILGRDRMVEAANFLKRHGADQITRRTVAEVVTELIEAKRGRGKSERYLGDLDSRLSRFATSHAVDISTVTTADVQRWLDRLKLAPQTAKNFRTVLFTLFRFAEARGYIFKGSNPAADTEKIDTNGGAAIEIFTPKEIAALLKNASKAFVPFLALGAFAGLRAMEIQRLDWRDVDLAGGFVHVSADAAKTRSRRLVPILPNLAIWLAPYSARKGKVWRGTPEDLKDTRAATVAKAKTAWKDNGLRHSFISYRLADIQNAAQVALEAGNSPAMVFKHYRELVKPEAAKAWFAIARKAPANVIHFEKAAQ